MSTKRITGFTHVHLPLVSDYSRVLCAQPDALSSFTHTTWFTHKCSVITRKYKTAWQELLASIFNLSAIFCVQCASHVARAQHTGCLQNFLRHDVLLKLFCKLGHELYYTMLNYQTINIPTRRDNLDSPLKLSYPVGSVYRVHMIHNAEFKIRKSRY